MSIPDADSSTQLMIENLKRGAGENVEEVFDYLTGCDNGVRERILRDLAESPAVPSVVALFATFLSNTAPGCDTVANVALSAKMKGVFVPLVGYCGHLPAPDVEVLVDRMLRMFGDDETVEACLIGLGFLPTVDGINKIFAAWHICETPVDLESRFYRLLRKTHTELKSNDEWTKNAARLCRDLEIKSLRNCAQEMMK